jgi:hypothetical protein
MVRAFFRALASAIEALVGCRSHGLTRCELQRSRSERLPVCVRSRARHRNGADLCTAPERDAPREIPLELGNYCSTRLVQPSVPSHNDRFGSSEGKCRSSLQRQETAAPTSGRATTPRSTESGERLRIDHSRAFAPAHEAHSSAPPTVPDALLLLDESEAAASLEYDPEPVPESRRTTLGPFGSLERSGNLCNDETATRRR